MSNKKQIFEVVEDDEPETENVVMDVEEKPKEKKERKKREYTAEQKAELLARLKAGRERKKAEREGKTAPKTKKPENKKEVKQEIKEVKAEIKEAKQSGNSRDMEALLGQLKILNNHFEKLSAQPKPHSAVAQKPEPKPEPKAEPKAAPVRPKTPPMPKTEIYCSRTNTYRYI